MGAARACCPCGRIGAPRPRGRSSFQRVIFQDRLSEGYASRTSNDQSRDDYFCLSFNGPPRRVTRWTP
jgi:hypothetical protein